MEQQVNSYFTILLELVLFSLIIGFIVFLSNIGSGLQTIGIEKREMTQELLAYRDISGYDNREVTGDDVLVTVGKFSKVYNIEIERGSVGSGDYRTLYREADDTFWTIKSVRDWMGSSVYEYYKVSIVRTPSGDMTGLKFSRIATPVKN